MMTPPPRPACLGASAASRRERSAERTHVYALPDGSKPSPVQIKTGISDGISTEVLEGLQEGDRVVTAMTGKAASAAQQSNNPLAGGQRRF